MRRVLSGWPSACCRAPIQTHCRSWPSGSVRGLGSSTICRPMPGSDILRGPCGCWPTGSAGVGDHPRPSGLCAGRQGLRLRRRPHSGGHRRRSASEVRRHRRRRAAAAAVLGLHHAGRARRLLAPVRPPSSTGRRFTHIDIDGEPRVSVRLELDGGDLPGGDATATRALNAIKAVCSATPTVHSALDLVVTPSGVRTKQTGDQS